MKTEVRFRNSGAVFETVYRVLRDRLSDQTAEAARGPSAWMREGAPEIGAATLTRGEPVHGAAAMPRGEYRSAEPPRGLRLMPDSAAPPSAQRPLGLGFARNDERADAAPASVPTYSELRVIGQLFAGYIALEGAEGMLLVDQHAAHERVTFEKLRAQLQSGGI